VTISYLHRPVLLDEVLNRMVVSENDWLIDGTFGRGGHSKALLDKYPNLKIIGIDRDPDALIAAEELKAAYPHRFFFVSTTFSKIANVLSELQIDAVGGILLDLGVSSPQFDDASRGFSFRAEADLDMRMSKNGISAADIVNGWSQSDLADIIYNYGDEKSARRVARAIVQAREESPISTTLQLADIVRAVVPKNYRSIIDEATKTFQAIRIAVNDEMGELESFLEDMTSFVCSGGRVGIISFHSTEDRMIKQKFRLLCEGEQNTSRHLPNFKISEPFFKYVVRNGEVASEEEIKSNPRSRSARLRCVEKI
jgi:16S rRNA (cytosine1402-N4)-methyltransferase